MLNHLQYADDIVIIAQSQQELQETLEELNEETKKTGLKMNLGKAKVRFKEENNVQIECKEKNQVE